MRQSLLPSLGLTLLAAVLLVAPDGAFQSWRLYLRGSFARLEKPPDPRFDASRELFSDHADLLDLLARKNAEIAELRKRLADLGVSRDTVPSATIRPARIIGLGPEDNFDVFTIDAGTLDGIAPGQAVLAGRVVVGIVAKSEARASLVFSLASPGCYLSARFGGSEGNPDNPRLLGAVRGIGGRRTRAILFLEENALFEGWLALTSGLEKGIPAGLILGRLRGGAMEGTESGTVEFELIPGVDIGSLNFVAVVAEKT
ncbi:MAG: hypothetical protein LBU64_12760 [Planctomycetota bacterium]|jgi:cell shape-determining protein MreC|nr:hypothetical protein [Planctomycetota bacterium]